MLLFAQPWQSLGLGGSFWGESASFLAQSRDILLSHFDRLEGWRKVWMPRNKCALELAEPCLHHDLKYDRAPFWGRRLPSPPSVWVAPVCGLLEKLSAVRGHWKFFTQTLFLKCAILNDASALRMSNYIAQNESQARFRNYILERSEFINIHDLVNLAPMEKQ